MAPPFVVARPGGARVRTRLRVDEADQAVLLAVGTHLGSLASKDLMARCRAGRLDAKAKAASRKLRKRALTTQSSSRWAGAITRTSEDGFGLAFRNLLAHRTSLRRRIHAIQRRLSLPVAQGRGTARGYATRAEHYQKRRRLSVLEHALGEVEGRLASGRVSVCRGSKVLANTRHHLDQAGLSRPGWQERWRAERLFITADGEADKAFGNETIRWHPTEGWVELRLPMPLAHLANRPHARYRLSAAVAFGHRGDEVAAQAVTGAVRYDVSYDPAKRRWYFDASWKVPRRQAPSLEELRRHPVVAVDLNAGHVAATVVDSSGNPVGRPVTIALDLAGLPASTRDGRLRAAISALIALAERHGAKCVVIEDLDFAAQRDAGREHVGNRPARGKRGKSFRALVAGLPTAKFRDRLVQMSANRGLVVVAVDPAYTSAWGKHYWLLPVREISPGASGHHAAALVIGRRGLGHRARRRGGCDRNPPVDGGRRATNSAGPGVASSRARADRWGRWAVAQATQDPPGRPATASAQGTQDRSGSPVIPQRELTEADERGTVSR
jgi:hypothetical protein